MQSWLSKTPADKMLQPAANAISPYMPNPKSILADRSQPPNNNNPLQRMNYFNNPRVTFAQGALNRRKTDGSSSTSMIQTPPGTAKDGRAGSPGQKQPGQINKYNFGVFQTEFKNKNALSAKTDAGSTVSEAEGQSKGGSKLDPRSTKNISVLYPADKIKPNKYKSVLNVGTGAFLPKSKSTEATVTAAKSTSTAHARKSTRSLTSNAPKRTKSGKKLKKRRKSKSAQLDKDMESFKPAKLDEEYASELNKITKILKAVSAFDEATATANGSVNFGSPSRNNIVTNYRYKDLSKMSVASRNFTTTAAPLHRPLSGDELKQLLSSITRVVSLHQLPIDTPLLSATKEANATTAAALTNLAGVRTSSPPKSLDEYRYHKFGPLWGTAEEEAPANDERSPSPPIKTKKKKSRKFSRSSLSSTRKPKSEVGKTKSGGDASASGTGSRKRRKSRPKYKSGKQRSGRAQSKDSISDLDKDPVKNALFLRKYFEESIRLANKKSSDELLQDEEENEKPKSKKKKSKKKSVSKKSSTKTTTTGKSRKST